ncbi:MAG: SurA N-terminal domain-containing protein, partial [Alphaproteobacteria bacterium]|nr:SurA N-terminal domain-containing protein [Alphaproteobacteria bacterium]
MISKLAKAKESWFFKIISAAVAVSFVSLFGVTGYIHNASQNLSVVKVGNKKTTQSEFSYRLQKETNAIKNLTGDDFEISEEMRNSLIEGVLKQIINENVLDLTMDKYGIHFPKAFVQQAIFSQREFINPANGQFNVEMFKRYLSAAGVSEAEYVAMIKRMMGQRLLVSDLIKNFGVPSVLSKAVHKMDNQRKSFKYAVVSPQDIKVERKISDDEIKQYYADFGERFTVPEMRDAVVLFIPNEVILSRFAATDDMARDYFNEHKKELDVPEKREVLQMVFTDKESAQKAYDKVLAGQDFYKVAKELKAENAAEPTLGLVAYDELADELATAAFDMQAQETKLLEVADTWQVIRIKQVTAAKDAVFEEVRPQIVETLANEKLYDATRELRGKIDDEINGGKPLNEVAKSLGFDLAKVQNISEEKTVADAPEAVKNAVSTLDFNELVFSYGLNETTSAEEFDDGIIVAEVTKITDEHLPEIDDIKDEIISLWTVE